MDKNVEIKALADRILYGFSLFDYLHTIGKAHIIGSYKMGIMAVNDLDIDVENEEMSMEKLYRLTNHILNTIKPEWYEGKEVINPQGQKEWFFGFEKEIKGQVFNVDIWFVDKAKIENTEKFCEEIIKRLDSTKRLATMEIKQGLAKDGIYGKRYHSLDVYDAVFNKQIYSYQDFRNSYKK